MARPRRSFAAVVLCASVLALVACGGGGSSNGANPAAAGSGTAPGGASADGPEGVTFTRFDGTTASFAAYWGTPLVVNFFASWCAPCVREMPEFEKLHRELGDRVAFLGIDVRDHLEEGKALAQRTGVSYDLARDPEGDVLTAVKGSVMPTTAFISADGRVVLVQSRTYEADDLRATIDKELLG